MSFISALANLAKSNLFLRIISSVFLIGIVVGNFFVLKSNTNLWFFYATIFTVVAVSFWELNNIFFKNSWKKSLTLTAFNLAGLFFIKTFWIFFALFVCNIILFNIFLKSKKLEWKKLIVYFLYAMVLVGAYQFVFHKLIYFPSVLILMFFGYLLLITITMDTFAYIFGRIFGKRKLAPVISPSKTVEGAIGALMSLIAVSYLLFKYLHIGGNLFYFLSLMLFGGVCAIVGDLLQSYVKRVNGVKDSSRLIPGHGGLLDRTDSFVFILFVVALYIWL